MAKATSQWDVLRHLKWVQPYDYLMATFLGLGGIGTTWSFLNGTGLLTTSILFFVLSCSQLWLVSLLFRCSFFVVQLMAKVKTLADTTARHALAYIHKKEPEPEELEIRFLFNKAQLETLRDVGWLKPWDYAVAITLGLTWATTVVLLVQRLPGWVPLPLGVGCFLTTTWCVVLCFRTSWFVLQVFADLSSVPREALKLIYLFERKA